MNFRLFGSKMSSHLLRNYFIGRIIQVANSTTKVIFKPRDFVHREKTNTKCGRSYAIKKLEELLGVKRRTALDLVLKTRKLGMVPGYLISNNYNTCKQYNIDDETCIKYPEILAQYSLEDKIKLIENLPDGLNSSVVLVTLDLHELQKFMDRETKTKVAQYRIKTFSRLLDITPEFIYYSYVKRPFLRNMSLERLEENVLLLKKNGITNEEITRDWWVVQYSPKTIQQRIDIARDQNIDKIKTWMVRGKSNIFEHYLKRRSDNKLVLGDNTVAEYLSERLDCNVDEAKFMMTKLPAIKNKSMKKLQEIIDFLYSHGFKPYHICRVPKILLHSVKTTQKRIRELEKQGMKMDSLHMLTKSQKQYMQYYEALVKSNKNKIEPRVAIN